MNIRGLGNASKENFLKDLLFTENPVIFFGQETMVSLEEAIRLFLSFRSGWHEVVVDAVGHSGGLISIWDPDRVNFKAFKFFGGIFLSGRFRGMEDSVNIINLYAPYNCRLSFWRRMGAS